MRKMRRKLIGLELLSFIVTVAPIVTVMIINRHEYFVTAEASVKLATGGIIGAVLLLFAALGRLKMPRRVVVLTGALVLCWLFESIMTDAVVLLGMALVGEVVNDIFIKPSIRKIREKIKMEKQGDVTSEKVRKVLEEYSGGRA